MKGRSPLHLFTLKRSVNSQHRVGRAAVLVIANVGAMKVEVSKRDESSFGYQLDRRCQFPFEASTCSHFFVSNRSMIQSRVAAHAPELLIHPITGRADVGAAVRATSYRVDKQFG